MAAARELLGLPIELTIIAADDAGLPRSAVMHGRVTGLDPRRKAVRVLRDGRIANVLASAEYYQVTHFPG